MKKTKGNISNTMYCFCETQTSVAKTQASDKVFYTYEQVPNNQKPPEIIFSYFRQKLHLIQSSWLGVIKHEHSKCSSLGFTQP